MPIRGITGWDASFFIWNLCPSMGHTPPNWSESHREIPSRAFANPWLASSKKATDVNARCAQIEAISNYLQSKFYGCMHRFTAIFRISKDWWFIVSCAAGTSNKNTHVRPTVLTPNRWKHLMTFTVRNQHHVLPQGIIGHGTHLVPEPLISCANHQVALEPGFKWQHNSRCIYFTNVLPSRWRWGQHNFASTPSEHEGPRATPTYNIGRSLCFQEPWPRNWLQVWLVSSKLEVGGRRFRFIAIGSKGVLKWVARPVL